MGHDLVLLPDGISHPELIGHCVDADIILMCYTPISEELIAASQTLKGIVKYGVGIDAIAIDAAINRNIPVVNIPFYAEETVAEGAFAMMMALFKRTTVLDRQMQRDGWAWPEPQWLGRDIAEKTIGIIGLGKIGRSFARMAGPGFRARVLAFDPNVPDTVMEPLGIEKIHDLKEMLGQSDVVSLHCVLNEQTRRILGPDEISAMKQGAILINSARGGLVDEDALCQALISGQLGGAGLDVFSKEPLQRHGHPMSELFSRDNVILSPHLTFYSEEAMARLETETLARCMEIINGEPVTIHSHDPRLRKQRQNVVFA